MTSSIPPGENSGDPNNSSQSHNPNANSACATDDSFDSQRSYESAAQQHGFERLREQYSEEPPEGSDGLFQFSPNSVWSGWTGIAIMLLGVVFPALLLGASFFACYERITLLLLKHPIETLIELAMAFSIPAANYIVWSALQKNDCRSTIKRGVLNGIAIGSSAIISLIAGVALFLQYPTLSSDGTRHGVDFLCIGLLYVAACVVSVYLAYRVRKTRIVQSSRVRAVGYVVAGVVLAGLAFIAAEARSTCIRVAAYMTTSEIQEQKESAIKTLRSLHPRREIMMECANAKAGGLPGMFIRLDNVTLRQLYFAVTGEPFRSEKSINYASMPDDYLQRHVVGEAIDGLSLVRSKLTGNVNPETLSSTLHWTFVLKNTTFEPREARAELGLPEGAAISGLTLYKNGKAEHSIFRPTGNQDQSVTKNWINAGHDAPAIVTDLGRGRVLMHCYPVPSQGQLKIAVAVTVPLKLHALDQASLPLPRFIDTNFSLKGNHHLRILSSNEIRHSSAGIKYGGKDGKYFVSGKLSEEIMAGPGISLNATRSSSVGPFAAKDASVKNRYVVQTIKELPSSAPTNLYVVLDGSESVKKHFQQLREALNKIPKSINTSVLLANKRPGDSTTIEPLARALNKIKNVDFIGGQDNLQPIVTAAERAGETAGGAVLWIHGPQPSFNKEIYIVSPYEHTPAFYELALDNGVMDPGEYFKHHREIGPFVPIPRNASAGDDLNRFLAKWQPGGHEYIVEYKTTFDAPPCKIASGREAVEMTALFAREKCAVLLDQCNLPAATSEAVLHNIVTPVSLASAVLSTDRQDASRLARGMHNRSVHILGTEAERVKPLEASSDSSAAAAKFGGANRASTGYGTIEIGESDGPLSPPTADGNQAVSQPLLQGASNGTIGPNGDNATAILGVNTAGTVRVNNLSNLEALLNIFASGLQLIGVGFGAFMCVTNLIHVRSGTTQKGMISPGGKCILGIALILFGLACPGTFNWFVASARDANLFS